MSYGFRACLIANPSTRVSSKGQGSEKSRNADADVDEECPWALGGPLPRARGPKQVSAPSFARVPSRLVPRACFRALSRRINDTIQLTWELPLRDPSQRFQTETETEMEGAPRQLKINREIAVQQ